MKETGWNRPQRVTLGVDREMLGMMMEEWMYREAPVTLTVRKARSKGLYAVIMEVDAMREPKGLYFASWCIDRCKGAKVDLKEM